VTVQREKDFQRAREEGFSKRQGDTEMGSLLGDWPSFDPHNFSQFHPADPTAQPTVISPILVFFFLVFAI
jgi:Det1 complexing ubiquitin ligase